MLEIATHLSLYIVTSYKFGTDSASLTLALQGVGHGDTTMKILESTHVKNEIRRYWRNRSQPMLRMHIKNCLAKLRQLKERPYLDDYIKVE